MQQTLLIAVVLSLLVPSMIHAKDAPPAEPKQKLIIGTRDVPPFAIRHADGTWDGVSIELWQQIAAELQLDYELRELPLDELLTKASAGELDVVVAAMTVTAEREERMDFSHPFFTSGLGIAVRKHDERGRLMALLRLFVVPLATLLAGVAVLIVLAGVLLWYVERKANPEHFGGRFLEGIGQGIWWAAVTMTTVGYGDKAPRTVLGRSIALVWMFVGVVVIALFTASVASRLTAGHLQAEIRDVNDLARLRTGTVGDSTGDAFLAQNGIVRHLYGDAAACLEALQRGEVDAVVFDRPTLRYLILQNEAGGLMVLNKRLNREDYAFVFPPESPLREQVNRVLLKKSRGIAWEKAIRRYMAQ